MSKTNEKAGRAWGLFMWAFVSIPILISAYVAFLSISLGDIQERIAFAVSLLSLSILLYASVKRLEAPFRNGLLLLIFSFAVAVHNFSISLIPALIVFGSLLVSMQAVPYLMGLGRRSMSVTKTGASPLWNVMKITALSVVLSAGLLLFAPLVALRLSSMYLIIIMAAVASLAGYYILLSR